MPKERNKADSYREKAYEGDTTRQRFRDSCPLLTIARSTGTIGINEQN